MARPKTKTEYMGFKCLPVEADLIRQAALLLGISESEFMRQAAIRKARRMLRKHQAAMQSNADQL